MKHLCLQGEVHHSLSISGHDESTISGKIVDVIRNTTSGHLDLGLDDDRWIHHPVDNATYEAIDPRCVQQPKQPPAVFVVTSDGYLVALDERDLLVWIVDLEKVVLNSQDDEYDSTQVNEIATRSEWFYGSGFLHEDFNADTKNDDDIIQGFNLNNQSLQLTCLSRAGHIVSVSIDQTTTISSQNGVVEEGSECIGSFENGLQCGGWSPDGEVLALVTYASEDEEGNEISVQDEEFRVPILITMNTQYEILSEIRLEHCLHLDPANAISFCWRPDSSSLAVSTMDANVTNTGEALESKPIRRIRTFNRTTLQLLSLSKEEDGSGRDVPNILCVSPTWASGGCSHYVGAVQSSRSLSSKSSSVRGRPISMQVAFMEPNGLRHRECKIHMTYDRTTESEEIISVEFNVAGDLLAVTSLVTPLLDDGNEEQSSTAIPYGKLQLYHRSNYHWYLKYEMRYDDRCNHSSSAVISKAQFSAEDSSKIMIALQRTQSDTNGKNLCALEWREYTFRWDSSMVFYNSAATGKDSSVVALSIDGKTLNMTPLDKALIPPPMYASSLVFPAPVVSITNRPGFNDQNSNEGQVQSIVVMSDGKLALVKLTGANDARFCTPTIIATLNIPNISSVNQAEDSEILAGMLLRDITIIDASSDSFTIVAISSPNTSRGGLNRFDCLIEMRIQWNSSSSSCAGDIAITTLLPVREGGVLRLVNWLDTAYTENAKGSALVELTDGTLLRYSYGGLLDPIDGGHLLEPCPWILGLFDANADADASILSSVSDIDHKHHSLIIGLSSRYRLYCCERLISSATSSYCLSIQHRFLTYVTLGSQPKMRFLPISTLRNFDPLMGSDENAALDGYEPRSVERGSRLVAIFPNNPNVVIQMPRGNLECISPRALALPYVMAKIRDQDYLTALDITRRQRIDTNLIVDFDPDAFLEKGGAEIFISQVQKIDNINLFLSSLIDIDTTLWKYPVPSWLRVETEAARAPPQSVEVAAKVNRVCVKMREVMLNAEKNRSTQSGTIVTDGHFLLPILSTFAKEVPARLEEALILIKSSASQMQPKYGKKTSALLSDHVQSSIQYLAFLANYELLYSTAIGLYDFELAKAVSRHSQMDPKVYLPMLKRWRDELPEATARFEVDVKLERYESALRHLVASGENIEPELHFQECLKFIEEHKLHSLGLQLFMHHPTSTCAIMASLGESLMTERKFEEALILFLSADPKNLDGAKRAAKACGDWQAYFSCCAELGKPIESDQIVAIAESISSTLGTTPKQEKESFASAARILLDYEKDVAYAVDMFISGRMWFEGRRISYLHDRPDLAKKCIDAASNYANSCIDDLCERTSTFDTANEKYAEVIVIRRDAIKEAEEIGVGEHLDDSASIFSMQSTASNSSLRSTASGSSVGSMGSVGSVSTVISVGTKTGFQFTGDRDTTFRHKSKFNKIGRDQKKKKKKKKGPAARRMKPGSEEHLAELIVTLKTTCPDEHYLANISETISFLLQSGKRSPAKLLFDAYHEFAASVIKSQSARLYSDRSSQQEKESLARKEGLILDDIEHPCEKEINEIKPLSLPPSIESVMSYLTS